MNLHFTAMIVAAIAISGIPNLTLQKSSTAQIANAQVNNSNSSAAKLLEQGQNQYDANKFSQAISSFQQALKSQPNKNNQNSVIALNGIGKSYNAIGKYQMAIASHEEALKLLTPANNSLDNIKTLSLLADANLNLGNEEKGLEIMERAITLSKNMTIPLPVQGEIIHNLGRAYSRTGQYDKALATFNQALAVKTKAGDRFNQGKTLNSIAGVYTQQQNFAKALEFAEQGLKLNQETKNQLGTALSLFNTGSIYGIIGQTPKALEILQQSGELYEKLGDRLSVGDVLNQVSNISSISFQFTAGVDLNQKALAIFKEYGDHRRIQAALEAIASAYSNVTQYPKALDFYAQALKAAERITNPELGDRLSIGSINYRMAEIYGTQGQHPQAIATYEKAINIYKNSLNIRTKLSWQGTLAGIYRGLGDSQGSLSQYPQALESLKQSLNLYEKIGDRRGQIVALLRIAPVYQQLGQFDQYTASAARATALSNQASNPVSSIPNKEVPKPEKESNSPETALAQVGKSLSEFNPNLVSNVLQNLQDLDSVKRDLEFFQKSGNRGFEASAYLILGNIYSQRKDFDQALNSYEQALKIYTEIGDRNNIASSNYSIGLHNAVNRKTIPAYYAFQKSLTLYRQLGDRNQESQVLSSLGTLFNPSQPELAIAFYKQSVNVTESIRKELKVLPKNQQQAYQQKIAVNYRSLADLLLRQGRVMEALQVLDLLKIQELQDYLQNVKGNDRTAQGIRLLEPEQKIIAQLSSQPDRLSNLGSELIAQVQKLPKSELNRVPKYLQNLPSGVVLFYPLILSDRLELILFSANNPPINRTVRIKETEFEELVKDFRSDLQNPISQDVKISGKKVYDLMIKPILADLKQSKSSIILYAPDDILRYIPLSALYDGNQWLVEQYQVNNLIAYSLLDLNSKKPDRKENLRIFAGAFGGKAGETRFGNQGLPATIAEIENITKSFASTDKFIEQNFSAKNIKTKLKGWVIVHLATHALFNSGSPLESFILFGDGSKVTLAEINEWQLKDTDLVVLSACETGVGTFGTGAEILGFGYQVQRAGAKASLASLWTVSDLGTQILMSGFYRNLQKENVLNALRDSQLTMIKKTIKSGETNFNHPYFWSSFIVIGNGI